MVAEMAVNESDGWLESGHEWVGQPVLRIFPTVGPSTGKITKWLPADEEAGEGALFHVVHDADGDQEDLEEEEARAAIEEYQALDAEVLRGLWARRGDKQRAYENKAERNVARRCTAASQAVEALREDLLELEASLLPALSQLEGAEEGGVSSWVSAARGATNKEVAGSKKGAAKKGKGAAPTGATNPFRGSERERWQRHV